MAEHGPHGALVEFLSSPRGTAAADGAEQPSAEPGYHLLHIDKAPVGTLGKVLEEALEAIDAERQDAAVMVLVELSDLIGAVQAYLAANHPSVTLADLDRMAQITARAFRSGRRS